MRLFALLAEVNKEGKFGNNRDIVLEYLERQFSMEQVLKYIAYFDERVHEYYPDDMFKDQELAREQILKNETAIHEICEQLNIELEHWQKVIVLVYLLDFINLGENLTQYKFNTLAHIAELIKIKAEEFNDIAQFTFGKPQQLLNPANLLLIDAKKSPSFDGVKYIYNKGLEGQIQVLHIVSSDTLIFRYYGSLDLLLNGHNIQPSRSYIWSVGSILKNQRIGSIYYIWVASRFHGLSPDLQFVFTAEDVEFRYGSGPNGIRKFNFNEESGRLIGIIGGSGSGKSTLLQLLNGSLQPNTGTIRINGYDIHENKEKLHGVIGYVPQDDLLIKELTVYENLYYNAKLCFKTYTEEQINEVVDASIFNFDLVEARNLRVGDEFRTILSGGQRKRLNIALELMREPSILFVDEPTSGLSSADSEKVMAMLKRQAIKGKLVISIIHQPSSDIYKLFDKILVLDQGGRVIFNGNPLDALSYFKNSSGYVGADESECLLCGNINADQILKIVEARIVDVNGRLSRKRKTEPKIWYRRYLEHIDPKIKEIKRYFKENAIPKNNFRIPGWLKQTNIFFSRDLKAKYANKQYLWLNLLIAPFLAFTLAFFTKDYTVDKNGIANYIFSENPNVPAYLFMSVIVALFLGLIGSAEEIFKDRKILKRESFLNLSRSSYLIAKIGVLFIISAIQTLVFVAIGNYMLEIQSLLLPFWLVMFSLSCWANLVGLVISSGLNSVVTIYLLIPLILVPQLLFSGVVVDFNNMHKNIASQKFTPVIGDVNASRWGYEALMVTQFKNNDFEKHYYESDAKIKKIQFYKNYLLPKLYQLTGNLESKQGSNSNKFLLENELNKLSIEYANYKLPNKPNFNASADTLQTQIENFLLYVDAIVRQEQKEVFALKEKVHERLTKSLENSDKLLQFRQKHANKKVGNIVKNSLEINDYIVYNNEIIPLKNSIYRSPLSNYGRAHYFSPYKIVGYSKLDTLWFNVITIWFFTFLLYVVLYFDLLRKVISYINNLRLNRLNKQIKATLKQITQQR